MVVVRQWFWSNDGGPMVMGLMWFDGPMVTMLFLGHSVVLLGRGFDFGSPTVVGRVLGSPTIRLLVGLAGGDGLCS